MYNSHVIKEETWLLLPLTRSLFRMNTDVVGHLERKAAARHAQAKEEGWTFYTVPSTFDAERFENVYEYELMMAVNEFSAVHKEVYNFHLSITLVTLGKMIYRILKIF